MVIEHFMRNGREMNELLLRNITWHPHLQRLLEAMDETNCSNVTLDGGCLLDRGHPGNSKQFESYNHTCGVYDFVIEAVFMGMLCLFGFGGNIVSIVCLLRDKSKTATPLLLVALQVADILFLVTVFLLRVLTTVQQFTRTLDHDTAIEVIKFTGRYVFGFSFTTLMLTIYLTILVTVNRYVNVCKPYEAFSLCNIYHAKRHILFVIVFSILYNLPRFLEFQVKHIFNPNTNRTDVVSERRAFAVNIYYQMLYGNAAYMLTFFLIPLVTLITMNYKLIVALKLARKKRAMLLKRESSEHAHARSEEDITRMLIVVVLIFVVCHTPALITQLLETLLPQDLQLCPAAHFFYARLSDLMVVANSALNFMVYCFCSRRFRNILKTLVCKAAEEGGVDARTKKVTRETAL